MMHLFLVCAAIVIAVILGLIGWVLVILSVQAEDEDYR